MKLRLSKMLMPLAGSALLLLGSGCAMFRASVADVNVNDKQHMDADYDYTDMKEVTQNIVARILAHKLIANAAQPPVMMIAGIQNRTQQFADMKNFTDHVRSILLESGKVRFVNEARREDMLKEQGFQAANVSPNKQIAIGQHLGAKFMISGSFTEMDQSTPRQVRISKQVVKYYKLTFEVTDLETGELLMAPEKEFARKESQPLIGW